MKMRARRKLHHAKQKRVYMRFPNGLSISWRAGDRNWKKKLRPILEMGFGKQ